MERQVSALVVEREKARIELEDAIRERDAREQRLHEKAENALEKIDAILNPYLEKQRELVEQSKNLGDTILHQTKYLSEKRSKARELEGLARRTQDRFERGEAKALLKELQKEIDQGDRMVKRFERERKKILDRIKESKEDSVKWKEKKEVLEAKLKEKSKTIQILETKDLGIPGKEKRLEREVDPSILSYDELYEKTRERKMTMRSLLDTWNTLNPIFKLRLEDVSVPDLHSPDEGLDTKVAVQRFEDAIWSHWQMMQSKKEKGILRESDLKRLMNAFIEKVEEEESKQDDA